MNIIMQTKKFESSTNTVWIGGPRDSLNTELSEGFEFIEFFMGTFVALKKHIFQSIESNLKPSLFSQIIRIQWIWGSTFES